MLAVPQENRTRRSGNMKIGLMIVAIPALGLFVGSSTASAAGGLTVVSKTGDGIWDGATWKVGMYPGKVKTTTIEFYNSSNSKLNVKVRIKPKSLAGRGLVFGLDRKNLTMAPRSHTEVTLVVRASESAGPGIYSADLEVKVAGNLKGAQKP